jgi:hypothetical protein
MAKTIYYDSVGLTEATITAGTVSGTTFSASSSAITNVHRINDQSISDAITSFGANDVIRIDFGVSVDISQALTHNKSSATEEDNLRFYYHLSSSTDMSNTEAFVNFSSPAPGWDLAGSVTSVKSGRYWFLKSDHDTFDGLTEMVIGKPLVFENEPDIGIATQEIFGTDLNTSLGGVEYANKRHEPKTTFQLNFSNISQTFKNNLVSFEQDVTNFKKFVYYDDSTYHYVRLDSPIKFTEVAFQRFSASLKLREQLS